MWVSKSVPYCVPKSVPAAAAAALADQGRAPQQVWRSGWMSIHPPLLLRNISTSGEHLARSGAAHYALSLIRHVPRCPALLAPKHLPQLLEALEARRLTLAGDHLGDALPPGSSSGSSRGSCSRLDSSSSSRDSSRFGCSRGSRLGSSRGSGWFGSSSWFGSSRGSSGGSRFGSSSGSRSGSSSRGRRSGSSR